MTIFEHEVYIRVISGKSLYDFIQKCRYENFLLTILKKSRLFPSDLEKVDKQSNGEYDYESPTYLSSNDEYRIQHSMFEATLLLNSQMCNAIRYDLESFDLQKPFLRSCSENLTSEIRDCIIKKNNKRKENVILFNIIPSRATLGSAGLFGQFGQDDWDRELDKILKGDNPFVPQYIKKLYVVSFTSNGKFYVKMMIPNSAIRDEVEIDLDETDFPFRIINHKTNVLNI